MAADVCVAQTQMRFCSYLLFYKKYHRLAMQQIKYWKILEDLDIKYNIFTISYDKLRKLILEKETKLKCH